MSTPQDRGRSGPQASHARIAAVVEGALAQAAETGDENGQPDAPWSNDEEFAGYDGFAPPPLDADGVDLKAVEMCAALDHSDTDNGERLRLHFGPNLTVVAQEGVAGGDWLHWTGRYWDLSGGLSGALMLAQKLGARIALEAEWLCHTPQERDALKAAEEFAADDDGDAARAARARAAAAKKALASRKAARWRFAVTSKNLARMKNMLDCAAPHLRRHPDVFNADPYAVACASHTLRFVREPDPDRDGRDAWRCEAFEGHRREDLLTAYVPHGWDAAATATRWRAFLAAMLPDEAKRRTVQAYCGACLLGVPLQRVMFHYGKGANGKSVFLETLTRALGDAFAVGLPVEAIVGGSERGAGSASPDIARLYGKRMVRILEIPEGKPLHEDLIKRLTGGEKFPVRTLFKGYFEFVNRAKPHMSGNGFPTIDGADVGIWRRVLVVHWDQTIPEPERREFEEVVGEFCADGAGLLQWLVEGALDFLNNGLVVADSVSQATAEYREEMDPVGEFLKACVVPTPGYSVPAREMYHAFVRWSEANAKRTRSETKFGRDAKKEVRSENRRGVKHYVDVMLHDVPEGGARNPDDGRDEV